MNKKSRPEKMDDAISFRLKEYYGAVEEEPIPTHLLDLLEKLDDAEEAEAKAADTPEKKNREQS